jgi:hypothetical protein
MFTQRTRGVRSFIATAFILTVPAFASAQLPIKLSTPGKASKVSKEQVCAPDYASQVKPIKKWQSDQALRAYGLREDSNREVVRLIPATLGGTNDAENLWPISESKDLGAPQKKALDEKLHQMVCSGSIELKAAQEEVKKDWVEAYKKHVTQ